MFTIFKRYQKFLIVTCAFGVTISMLFFSFDSGARSRGPKKEKAVVVFKTQKGSEYTDVELRHMAHFLANESEGYDLNDSNPLNFGILSELILETGLGEKIWKENEKWLLSEIQAKRVKELAWVPYQHPHLKHLSLTNLWQQFAPEVMQFWQKSGAVDLEDSDFFKNRTELFLSQKKIPQNWVKQLIQSHESMSGTSSRDPRLASLNLNLYGHRNIEDWFGKSFMYLCAQTILEGADQAERLGIKVSPQEIDYDLSQLASKSYKSIKEHSSNISLLQWESQLIQRTGMETEEFRNWWKKVLLCRRFFNLSGNKVLIDTSFAQAFTDYSNQAMSLEVYKLDPDVKVDSFQDLQMIQAYLQAVSSESMNQGLVLPSSYKLPQDLVHQAAELVVSEYQMKLAEVNESKILSQISQKELWKWAMMPENYSILMEEFPKLALSKDTEKERLSSLQSLSVNQKNRVNSSILKKMLEVDPEMLLSYLNPDEAVQKTYRFPNSLVDFPLEGIHSPQKFFELLNRLEKDQETISNYTQDSKNYYYISEVKKLGDQVMLFSSARKSALEITLNRALEAHYAQLKSAGSSAIKIKGRIQDFETVRNQVALHWLQDTLVNLRNIYQSYHGGTQKEPSSIDSDREANRLAAWWWYSHLQSKLTEVKDGLSEQKETSRGSLFDQWALKSEVIEVVRSNPIEAAYLEAFDLKKGDWFELVGSQKKFYPVVYEVLKVSSKEGIPWEISDIERGVLSHSINRESVSDWYESMKFSFDLSYLEKPKK